MITEVKTVELRLRCLGRTGWSEHLAKTSREKAEEWLEGVIRDRGPEEWASYKVTIMLNGGYGRNKETGSTSIINWSGQLNNCPAWSVMDGGNPMGGS